jgi:hypothetical protein
MSEDNTDLEFYNYLIHRQMLQGVIEFSISLIQFVRVLSFHSQSYSLPSSDLCELSTKCSMCKNLSHVMVLP